MEALLPVLAIPLVGSAVLAFTGKTAMAANSGREVGGFRNGWSENVVVYGSSPARTARPTVQKMRKSNPKRS